MPPPRVVRSAFLGAYATAARSVGLDPELMMRRVGVPVAAANDPECRISADRVHALLCASAVLSGRDDFGLVVGDHIALSMLGSLGRLMQAQPTVRAAFEVYAQFAGHMNDSLWILLQDCGTGVFVIPVIAGQARSVPRATTDLVTSIMDRFLNALAPGARPQLVCFDCPAPGDIAPYRQRFDSLAFGHAFSGVLISSADLARPLATADAEAARTIVRLIESRGSVVSESMVERVSALIERLLPTGDCSARRVAQMMGVDRRTIYRRLATEDVTFTSLVDRMRRDMAASLLRRRGQRIAEMADLLGFSSLSSFSRWFHRTHGASAREYRKAG